MDRGARLLVIKSSSDLMPVQMAFKCLNAFATTQPVVEGILDRPLMSV